MIVKHDYSSKKYRYGGSSININQTKYRYGGNGIFTNLIGRRLLNADNVKNLINAVSKSHVIQKAANAVQDGATNAVKWQMHKGAHDYTSNLINNDKKPKKRRKYQNDILNRVAHSLADTIPSTTASIEGIVRKGSGIVYD